MHSSREYPCHTKDTNNFYPYHLNALVNGDLNSFWQRTTCYILGKRMEVLQCVVLYGCLDYFAVWILFRTVHTDTEHICESNRYAIVGLLKSKVICRTIDKNTFLIEHKNLKKIFKKITGRQKIVRKNVIYQHSKVRDVSHQCLLFKCYIFWQQFSFYRIFKHVQLNKYHTYKVMHQKSFCWWYQDVCMFCSTHVYNNGQYDMLYNKYKRKGFRLCSSKLHLWKYVYA